jgi:hypothetical protein
MFIYMDKIGQSDKIRGILIQGICVPLDRGFGYAGRQAGFAESLVK